MSTVMVISNAEEVSAEDFRSVGYLLNLKVYLSDMFSEKRCMNIGGNDLKYRRCLQPARRTVRVLERRAL